MDENCDNYNVQRSLEKIGATIRWVIDSPEKFEMIEESDCLNNVGSSPQLSIGSQDDSPGSQATTPLSDKLDRLDMGGGGRSSSTSGGSVAGGDQPPTDPPQPTPIQILNATPGSSKARQKKFHRHFKNVAQDERVLNYYSCALVADILLQGHLYITKNYFAFYSNVFGYITKLLIPTATVIKVTKEKTAYIIPNAVGITTEDDKHVFGSLLSRDSTYKLMVQVWSAAVKPIPLDLPLPDRIEQSNGDDSKEEFEECGELPLRRLDEESSVSGSELNIESKLNRNPPLLEPKHRKHKIGSCVPEVKSCRDVFSQTQPLPTGFAQYYSFLSTIPRPTLVLGIATLLLILLFATATVLLFRVARLQEGYSTSYFTSRSISEVQHFLDVNIEQISKVRQSLETLSLLIEGEGSALGKHHWNTFVANENFHPNS